MIKFNIYNQEFYNSEFFHDLSTNICIKNIFKDSKLISDSIPNENFQLSEILNLYEKSKTSQNFDIVNFFKKHFTIQPFKKNKVLNNLNFEDHCKFILESNIYKNENIGSSIDTSYFQNSPGGRFKEFYYWDSYFIALGFAAMKRYDLIENIISNMIFFIKTYGFIPNGARTYYLSRSQPPFLIFLIKLIEEYKGIKYILKYVKFIEAEYKFWMKGLDYISEYNKSSMHVVKMQNGMILNRYWDKLNCPRPEAYYEDFYNFQKSKNNDQFYRNLRAAAESGFDFSSRWFKDIDDWSSICTIEIIPVELNSILFFIERSLYKYYKYLKNFEKEKYYESAFLKRKDALNYWCWDKKSKFFKDCLWTDSYKYNKIVNSKIKNAGCFMTLFTNFASNSQALKIKESINKFFIKDEMKKFGGICSTLKKSRLNHQWDYSNAWSPIQYITIEGLKNYKFNFLSNKIKNYWINYIKFCYNRDNILYEKYNLTSFNNLAEGGEYKVQNNFGWTAGVCLSLLNTK